MYNIIPVKFDKLTTIAQIADIHIRILRRHDEYKQCFDILYKQLREELLNGNGIIVVAGDVVHAKTDMSPEMIQLASEFLNTLANIAPTIVIAGNHDCNLSNVNRLDALSPIIDNLKNPNLHYLKHSGIYTVADVDFAVHSILDDRSKWPVANDCKAKTKIALYHGPIYGAKTDSNDTITDRHVEISLFNGFDIVMLGDVHKKQTLQEYSVEEIEVDENEVEQYLKDGWEIVVPL